MKCPECQAENQEGRRFCGQCGARLGWRCSACGFSNNAEDRFCGGCGAEPSRREEASAPLSYTPKHLVEKILRERSALEGERRTVTVLFADAVGFTPLSERVDEEEVYDLIKGGVAHMMEAVHRYEGTVTQFRGDGVMAMFGAPIAHEDAARRAVAAALEMQEALEAYAAELEKKHGVSCRFRVGLNTGPVVVGKVHDDLAMDYTAHGDTANLGARLESAAEPGSVYLSEHTFRAVEDYIECELLGELEVKGKAESVIAYKALREKPVRTRFEAAAERGLTAFVGRAHELTVLTSHLEQVRRGQGQVAFVSGEAGIGKSRLLLELRRSIQDEPVTWLEGQCISFGRHMPYLPIIDLLKHAFGVEEGDNDARIIERVTEGTDGWEESAKGTVPYLRFLLNVDPGDPAVTTMDPRLRRAGVLDGLRALVLQESRRQPLVVVVEDLHWIDEQSEAALVALVDVVASAPVLLILTYRPGYTHSLGERTFYSRLALGDLRPEEGTALAREVLRAARLPEELGRLIIGKAEGNPFYIEEVTKSLLESGAIGERDGAYVLEKPVEEVHVPETIQEVILARIDRLERKEREALQLASVIGREFTLRLLDRISEVEAGLEEILGELKVLELIYQKGYFPELSYMFKHALTHDVAYGTLLRERRKALHRIIGAAVEELYADRLAEHYETLAHHYGEGEDWDKALDYLVKAGDKAAAAYANKDALDFYARALAVCEKLGEPALATSADAALKRGFVNIIVGDLSGAIADFHCMLETARSLKDRHLEGRALAFRGFAEYLNHDLEASEPTLRTALEVAEEGYEDVRLLASAALAMVFTVSHRHAEAGAFLRAAQELAPRVEDVVAQAWYGAIRSHWLYFEGRFDDALESLALWRDAGEKSAHALVTAVAGQWVEAVAVSGKGYYEKGLALLEEVLATCGRIGDVYTRLRALNTIGWIYGELQDQRRAMEWNTRGIEAAREASYHDPEIDSNARLNLGDNFMALGRLDEAERYFRKVEELVRRPGPQERVGIWRYSQRLFHSHGELWLIRGDDAKALAYADECLEVAEGSNSRKNIVKARRLRGQVFLARGHLVETEEELAIALEVAKQVGNPPQLWKTHVAQGDLRQAQGKRDETRRAYHAALAVIDGVAAGLSDASLRETFLNSDHVQDIRKKAEG